MKKSKLALIQSIIALLLCASMLIGTTFAWFTESVSSGNNLIAAGNLDVELEYRDAAGEWQPVTEESNLFEEDALWEPGHTEVIYLKISNLGQLALKYQFGVNIVAELVSTNMAGEPFKLSDHIHYGIVASAQEPAYTSREDARKALSETQIISQGFVSEGKLYAPGTAMPEDGATEQYVTLVAYMPEDVGNAANYQTGANPPKITLGLAVVASQEGFESDSFGSDYDIDAVLPEFDFPVPELNESTSADVIKDENHQLTQQVSLQGSQSGATVPEGVQMNEDAESLTLTVKTLETSGSNLTLDQDESLLSLDVHMEGVSADNTVPMTITLKEVAPKGLNSGNLKLYHVENGQTVAMTEVASDADFTAHNQFKYDPATGNLELYMATFSEVTLVANTVNPWNGEFDYDWYAADADSYTIANADQLAGFGAIVGGMHDEDADADDFDGKTVTLLSNINLNDTVSDNGKVFYPIGYHNSTGSYEKTSGGSVTSSVSSFSGTFDGAGHTISNFYQNTWEMFGDYNDGYSGTPNHYKDAMGLFGYVLNGTVKNLTVSNFSSDGEFTPTGVIAAYAVNSKFENIAITNCNPRVYNTGNGGIVGIGGKDDDSDTYKLTFNNITIDNSNTITALWGSWDVACGGLVGMFRGAGHVYMTNCHVAAQMDVYNDVCGNYQYYWYRYAGMLVGTNKNMVTENGKTRPKTEKFHATNCTVHFGEWNDYYYCELVANSLASYTHDHQFSRLTEISSLDEIKSGATWTKAGNFLLINGETKTCYHIVNDNGTLTRHRHEDAGTETVNGETVLKEDNQIVYLPFNQLFTGYGWGVEHIPIYNDGTPNVYKGVTILDRPVADSQDKSETKFVHTGYIYRVGNEGQVPVGCLFAAKDGVTINNSGVYVTIDKVDATSNASGKFTANTTKWEDGYIEFDGTGRVKITIQDYDYCNPETIEVEVVDAVNATNATNATKNNVVLLNDCGFSSLVVSGGYSLYGNGFTMTCGSDSAALDMGYSFVTLNNGTLDNVQIVCPNFDYAVLYKSNMTSDDNRSETTDRTRYYNVKGGVMASGNSQILNSRISGGRAAVNVSGGNVVIDNSRIELGAVANILVGSANSLTLRDVTLVQKPAASTYDSSKKLMGFSVLYMCDSEGKAASTTLEGTLVQNAWVNADDKQYVPDNAQDIVDGIMKETAFIHNINGKDSLNLGFAYMPEDVQNTVAAPDNITDNRTNKADVPYEMKDVAIRISLLKTTVYVYSYKNTNGTDVNYKTESEYVPNKYGDIITVTYSDTADGLTTGKRFETNGWVYELNVDLDKLSGYALDFGKLTMSVNGVNATEYKVDGNAKPTSPVAVTAGGATYTLTATVNDKEYTAIFKVTGTETSKESPSLVASNYEAGLCVASSYGGTWHGAAPALQGIQIKYWSVAEKQYKTIKLADYTPTTKGKLNGTNTTWTYSPANGDFTLTLTGGQVHSSNNVYAMPVVCDGKLYFVAASSKGLVNSGNSARTIPVTYTFKDNNNGDVLTFSHTWSVAENKDAQYKYSEFCEGTLTKLEAGSSSSGGGCVTPDTLITLADGSQVRVDSLTGNEQLMVWNMETGKLDSAPILFVDNDPETEYEIVHLYFSDGTDVKVIYEHGFWDYDLNKYVYLDADAAQYIGHTFAKQNGSELAKVKLTNVVLETEVTTAWSPVTEDHLCYFVNGMLSMPGGVGGLFNIFDVNPETMAYDYEAMARDIETYGLFTYEELNAIAPLSEDMFNAAGGAYLKVSIGKGNLTMEELINMINRYSKFF